MVRIIGFLYFQIGQINVLNRGLKDEIDGILGKELRGKLNESLLLILLIKNYQAAQESKTSRSFGFRGRRDKKVIKEGLTTRIVAEELEMPQSTVATAVNRLVKRGLVTHSKGLPIMTTEDGREVAKEKLRHHRLLEVLFSRTLGLSPDDAHNESVKLMLLTSCNLVNIISQRFNDPKTCPCGLDIPEADLCSGE
ncbi:MAG: metal-dependent transcriptional regulator [Candidatus Kariarchaeaceae archaeon]|jgi:Mn-dependent DtxR family transcriptional regulator